MLWKVSFNYLVDVKGVADAPRIIKLQKILDEFKPDAVEKNKGAIA